MRLIILYSSRGVRNHTNWDPKAISKSSMAIQYSTDGYSYLSNKLIENGIIDEALAFVETGKYFGHRKITDKHNVYAIPYITCVDSMLQPDDVLFIRGGWKHWDAPLRGWHNKHWMIYYGAGTPRNHWPYWQAVFNDFIDKPVVGKRSIHPTFPFTKPIHYDIFKPLECKKEYDVLLNSCFHIYDKKGQYLAINAAVEYKKLFGKDLSIAMPGGVYRNTFTSQIANIIKTNDLKVYQPGVIPREDLNSLINHCKLYVHIGYGEQNARSALEAMRCGLPLYIASPHLWPKFVGSNPDVTRLCKTPGDPVQVAKDIHQLLLDIDQKGFGASASQYFEKHNSPEITVGQFTQLLKVMKKNSKPDQTILAEALIT